MAFNKVDERYGNTPLTEIVPHVPLMQPRKDHPQVEVMLEDLGLWNKFHRMTNEMIVTRKGRRMFPVIKLRVTGLKPEAFYAISLEFRQIQQYRWKYINGEWLAGGKADPLPFDSTYCHPDSPNYGDYWTKEPISFQKVKLTNKGTGKGQIMLNSLHKYVPIVRIIKVGSSEDSTKNVVVGIFAFPICQFIAVTAYQNKMLTLLKIEHNPFAKAFLDSKSDPDQQKEHQQQPLPSYKRKYPHHPSHLVTPSPQARYCPYSKQQPQTIQHGVVNNMKLEAVNMADMAPDCVPNWVSPFDNNDLDFEPEWKSMCRLVQNGTPSQQQYLQGINPQQYYYPGSSCNQGSNHENCFLPDCVLDTDTGNIMTSQQFNSNQLQPQMSFGTTSFQHYDPELYQKYYSQNA